jgi:DNA polymerase-3 subunit alpha
MEAARIIGGFSLKKGDILRRAFNRKNTKILETLKREFLTGARGKGFDAKHAEDIFDLLENFADDSILKSHVAAYTAIAYKTAYCKANYPSEFHAATIHMKNI